MQSGISASQELKTAFQKLVTSPNQRGLLCSISQETLIPLLVLEPATNSFSNDLSTLLAPHLKPNVALYVILRRYPETSSTSGIIIDVTAAPFVAITYVPDAAPVRSKMLFASTRLTLVRELGIERFRETIFATTSEELSADGFEKHDRHMQLEAPLTEEERSLFEVKQQEAKESQGGMMQRKSCVMSSLSMSASDEVIKSLTEFESYSADALTNDHINLVQIKINIQNETLELDSQSITSVSNLANSICATAPRFSFYRYLHTHNGHTVAPILFIYTCPSTSKLKERMLYAASSRSIQDLAQADLGLRIEKKIEEGHPGDITEQSILADLYPQIEVVKRFDRPRRPGANRIAGR